jgi:hypothetical protein
MQFNKDLYTYLQGDQFSSTLGVDLRQEKYLATSREEKILEITRGTQMWDFALFGEIVEHLDNLVEFLSTYTEMLNYRELVNSDHRFWFTPYTIGKVIAESGMKPEQIHYANRIELSQKELIGRKLKQAMKVPVKYPFYYFNSLIVTCTL